MATLARYPLLGLLLDDLTRLSMDDAARAAREQPAGGIEVKEGRDATLVSIPWAGQFWLTGPQREVVRQLIDAYASGGVAEVSQGALLAAASSKARRLEELFRGTDVVGRLVVPGKRAGHYRLAPPPGDRPTEGRNEEPRVVEDE